MKNTITDVFIVAALITISVSSGFAAPLGTPTMTVVRPTNLMSRPLALSPLHYRGGEVSAVVMPGETLTEKDKTTVPTIFGNQTWIRAAVSSPDHGDAADGWVSERNLLHNTTYHQRK